MSPSKPAGVLKVRVPRQNAQRLGPAVTQEVRTLAREQGINVQLPPPVQVQPTSAGPSSDNASEWNSMLTTARADRGPQWDVGTQQFLVEQESELYYDPTPLLEAARASKADGEREDATNRGGILQPNDFMMSAPPGQVPQQYRNPYQSQNHNPNQQYSGQYGNHIGHGSPAMSHTGAARNAAFPGQGVYNAAVSQGQFYVDGTTPTRGGSGMGDGMASPDVRRRVTRGMAEEFPGMYGN